MEGHDSHVDAGQDARQGDRPCPVSAEPMTIDERRGVRVDLCFDHGAWFDHGELETVLRSRQGRAVRRARNRRAAARRTGVVHGALFGGWALLFD